MSAKKKLMLTIYLGILSVCLMSPMAAWAQINLLDSLSYQSLQRKFMVHLPTGYSNQRSYPVVINLHGGSGNMVNAQGFSLMNTISDQQGFIVVWPQGAGIAPPGFSWADGRNTSADQAGIDDVGFLNQLLDVIGQRFSIDTNRQYLCGFSNGGFMTQRIACQRPGRFAAMATLGCSMDTVLFTNCRPAKPVPMAFFNGTDDPAMPYYGGRLQNPAVLPVVPVDTAVRFWVKHNNCTTASAPQPLPDVVTTDSSNVIVFDFTNCDCNANVKFYRIIGGGHTWPGVFVASQAAVLGRTNRDINGSQEVWNFLSQHSLCATTTSLNSTQTDHAARPYPVPATSRIIFRNLERISRYNLINAHGVTVLSGNKIPEEGLDINGLPAGVYLLHTNFGIARIEIK